MNDITLEHVTPAMAEEWLLKYNYHNRDLRRRKTDEYADAMLSGDWVFQGDPIRFAVTGRLLDGQNRLNAIIKSGTTQLMLIVRNLPESVFDRIDVGAVRTKKDALQIGQVAHYSRVASAVPVIDRYYSGGMSAGGFRTEMTAHEVLTAVADEYSDLPELIEKLGATRPKCMQTSVFDGFAYVFYQIDAKLALEYARAIRDGIGTQSRPTWHYLRERLLANRLSKTAKMSRAQEAALFVKGWNFARRGMHDVVYKFGWSPQREGFPDAE